MRGDSPPDDSGHHRDLEVSDFRAFRDPQPLTSYDGADLEFVCTGPRVGPAEPRAGIPHEGAWLVTWREGGRLSTRPDTPLELSGIPRWLAIPISNERRTQILTEHISLREAICFAEWDPYLLTGPDPLAPNEVAIVRIPELPRGYIPTSDVSVQGRRIPSGARPERNDVLIHLVPDGGSDPSPSIADAGAILEALSRFLGWVAQASITHRPPTTAPREAGLVTLPSTWSRLSFGGAGDGTLRITARIATVSGPERDAIKGALAELQRATGSSPRIGDHPEDPFYPVIQSALFGLMDLLRQVRISVAVKWEAEGREEAALIGGLTAQASADRLSDELASQLKARNLPGVVVRVPLSPADLELLTREVDRDAGGFERLLSDLAHQVVRDEKGKPVLDLRPDQVERVVRYVQRYGGGGAQDRLRPIYLKIYQLGIAFVGIR